jgi:hypothetical protein
MACFLTNFNFIFSEQKQGTNMNKLSVLILGMSAIIGAAGCNNAKSPDAVANDVAAAQQKSASEVADAEKSAAKKADSAETKVEEKKQDLNETEAKGAYDVATTKAEGDHKVATEKCMTLAGDAQKACKDQADAKYDMAKANAKASEAAQKQ